MNLTSVPQAVIAGVLVAVLIVVLVGLLIAAVLVAGARSATPADHQESLTTVDTQVLTRPEPEPSRGPAYRARHAAGDGRD